MNTVRIRVVWILVIVALVATAGGGFVSTSKAQDDRETQVFTPEPFDSIELRGAGSVSIEIGGEPRVEITTARSISGLFDTTVEDGTLQAGFGASVAFDLLMSGGIDYLISAPSLDELELIGPLDATIAELSTDELSLDLTRRATVNITDLEVTTLEVELSQASSATLSGTATEQNLEIENASSYDAASLETARTSVNISNASQATVRVTDALSGVVENASTLDYLTEAATINVDARFASSINALPYVPLATAATPVAEATPPPATPASTGAQTFNVSMAQFKFDPATIEVSVGDTVTWTNEDRFPHDVTQLPNGTGFASAPLSQGQSFSVTFDTPGTYDYFCALHPIMLGTVVVTD